VNRSSHHGYSKCESFSFCSLRFLKAWCVKPFNKKEGGKETAVDLHGIQSTAEKNLYLSLLMPEKDQSMGARAKRKRKKPVDYRLFGGGGRIKVLLLERNRIGFPEANPTD